MKTAISTILFFALSLSTLCPAQKYHDALLNEIKGPVKLFGNQHNLLYEYDTDGALTAFYYGNREEEYGFKCERNAQGYVTALHLFKDLACTEFDYTITYTYNSNWQIVSESYTTDSEARTDYYTYNENGYRSQQKVYINGELIGTINFDYDKFDEMGNWTTRYVDYGSEDDLEQDIHLIEYWDIPSPEPATPSEKSQESPSSMPLREFNDPVPTGWQALIGKKLLLTTYGLSKNGQEATRFQCQTGEYIELKSIHRLHWNNRYDGNIIYHYDIDGNRINLIQLTGKEETDDKWFVLVWQEGNLIKTESNLGTYRYFSITQ